MQATKDKTGNARALQAAIINGAMSENVGGGKEKYFFDRNSPWFQDLVERNTSRFKEHKHNGMILEVAETRCGGPENLQKAVRRGAITVVQDPDTSLDLYYFPEKIVGRDHFV